MKSDGMDAPRDDAEQRAGEIRGTLSDHYDAGLFFIGRIRTPWARRADCPRRGDLDGPECRLDIDPRWIQATLGLDGHAFVQVLYWMHLSRRNLTVQKPRRASTASGTFALRSPMRPNPIASSRARLVGLSGTTILVRGLDCIDGTPLVDLKPEHCPSWPDP